MENSNFIEMPQGIQTWFLDTCVWSEIISSKQNLENFISYFQKNNYFAGLTLYTIFELSRAKYILKDLDYLFIQMKHNIWIPLFNDDLFDYELRNYPIKPKMRWMTIMGLVENDGIPINLLQKIITFSGFIDSRNDHLQFGKSRFMSLEEFKKNFPPSENSNYSTDQAYAFSRFNAISYFLSNERNVLEKIGVRDFLPEGIPSQFARSLFLFYKYYVHGQSPVESDFLDFTHISYTPYFNVYVTEKNVSNVLNHIKSEGIYFKDLKVIKLTQFMELITK
jgi:hypothetical protein